MKKVAVQLLTNDKKVIWCHIPWGKKHLDELKQVGVILQTHVYSE